MNAAASAMSPPRAQTSKNQEGRGNWRATTDGFMKMPDPMMPPMTIMVASNRPRRRASAGAGWFVAVERLMETI